LLARGRVDLIPISIARYEVMMQGVVETIPSETLTQAEKDQLQETLAKSDVVLNRVMQQVPESAKDAIQHAIDVSHQGQEKIKEVRPKGKPTNQPGPAPQDQPTGQPPNATQVEPTRGPKPTKTPQATNTPKPTRTPKDPQAPSGKDDASTRVPAQATKDKPAHGNPNKDPSATAQP
jgi:hypothetical protein